FCFRRAAGAFRTAVEGHQLGLAGQPGAHGAAEPAARVVEDGEPGHRACSGGVKKPVGGMGGGAFGRRSMARRRNRLNRNRLKKCIRPSTNSTVPTLSLRSSMA